MGLSLVRCPFCDRRYNVTGIPPGTRVLCTSCRTVLTVPGNRFVAPPPVWHRFVPRSGLAQVTFALFGGLLLATVCYLALKEAQVQTIVSGPPAEPPGPVARQGERNRESHPSLTVHEKFLGGFRRNDRFQIYESADLRPFVLIGDKNASADLPGIFEKFEELLPKLYRTFMQEFGDALNLERIENSELPIVFYTRRETYDEWWKSVYKKPSIQQVTGVFSYPERRVSLYYDIALDSIDAGRTREVLLHERADEQHQEHDEVQQQTPARPQPTRPRSEEHGAYRVHDG